MVLDVLESAAQCLTVKKNKSSLVRFIYKVLLMEEIFAVRCIKKLEGVNADKDEG